MPYLSHLSSLLARVLCLPPLLSTLPLLPAISPLWLFFPPSPTTKKERVGDLFHFGPCVLSNFNFACLFILSEVALEALFLL